MLPVVSVMLLKHLSLLPGELITIIPDHSCCFHLLLKPVDHEGPYWEQL